MNLTKENLDTIFEAHTKCMNFIRKSSASVLTQLSALEALGHVAAHLPDQAFTIQQPNDSDEIKLEWIEYRPGCSIPDRISISLIKLTHRSGYQEGNRNGGSTGLFDAGWASYKRNIKEGVEPSFEKFYKRRKELGMASPTKSVQTNS